MQIRNANAGPFRPQYLNGLSFRLARVDDDWQPRVTRQSELTTKRGHLHLARRVVIVKIESDFSPGDHAPALSSKTGEPLFRGRIEESGVVRVYANRRVNVRMLLGQLYRSFQRAAVRISSAHIQNRRHARIARALDYGLTVGIKLRPVKVCMRINKHVPEDKRWKSELKKGVTHSV